MTAGWQDAGPGTRTTLADLMDTLRKLDEEDGLLEGKKDKNQTPRNWREDLERSDAEKCNLPIFFFHTLVCTHFCEVSC